jgi:hypothetical protein
MFGDMVRRLFRPLLYVIALMQLVSTPVFATAVPAGAGDEMPCHGVMAPADEGQCPCCPDGVDSAAGCLAGCAGATATPLDLDFPIVAEHVDAIADLEVISNGDLADPPLKPPPIL